MPIPDIFQQFLGGAAAQVGPVLRELGEWFTVLQGHALKRWTPIVVSGARCSVRKDKRPCGGIGMVACELCGQVVCLRHAAVACNATAICETCSDDYAEVVKGRAKERPEPEPAPGDPAAKKRAALRKLGLAADSTWDEVKAEYRVLVKKYHPDKHHGASPSDRKKVEQKMREINDAYAVLEQTMKA